MTEADIIHLIRAQITRHPMENHPIEVLDHHIERDGDWWYVPVRPVRQEPKTYAYYDYLSDIEAELKQQENLDILLVPAP